VSTMLAMQEVTLTARVGTPVGTPMRADNNLRGQSITRRLSLGVCVPAQKRQPGKTKVSIDFLR
jgi:hypothetical protein